MGKENWRQCQHFNRDHFGIDQCREAASFTPDRPFLPPWSHLLTGIASISV